ncbi:MAG TPA: DUF447 domain-containing protein [Acidobacteriota bacterium]|nr:DUF447 domain-containing protein [Acidobacteriota bacterium]
MIIETIFSTLDEAGTPNFAPMGIEWGEEFVVVRPFRSSQTCRNLLARGCGVANLSDNVLAFVESALYDKTLPSFPAKTIPGAVYRDTCGWIELKVVTNGGSEERAELKCRILHHGRQKDFLGFCRAGNAVIEATILATRLSFYGKNKVLESLNQYMRVVEKTGSEIEKQAFKMLYDFVNKQGE